MVKETSDDPLPAKRSKAGLVGKRRKAKSPLRLIDEPSDEGVPGPARLVVLREPVSEKFQPLLQRRPPMPTESFAQAKSPSMDAKLNLTVSETESDEEASKINAINQEEGQAGRNPSVQDEGQVGPNSGVQDEGQARPNPGIAAESQLQSSHVVHARPNLEHLDLGTSDASTQ
ncbi:hypothetical protein Tco_1145128 [Tanacetum coccineum]